MFRSNYNKFKNNVIKNNTGNNGAGMFLKESYYNTLKDNIFISNEYYGVRLYDSYNNLIYHNNFVENGQNANDNGSNKWDAGYLAYPSPGGNYWDDYTGVDEDGDGIGDTPYYIPEGDNKDNYPFMEPDGWVPPVVPPPPSIPPVVPPPPSTDDNDPSLLEKLVELLQQVITNLQQAI